MTYPRLNALESFPITQGHGINTIDSRYFKHRLYEYYGKESVRAVLQLLKGNEEWAQRYNKKVPAGCNFMASASGNKELSTFYQLMLEERVVLFQKSCLSKNSIVSSRVRALDSFPVTQRLGGFIVDSRHFESSLNSLYGEHLVKAALESLKTDEIWARRLPREEEQSYSITQINGEVIKTVIPRKSFFRSPCSRDNQLATYHQIMLEERVQELQVIESCKLRVNALRTSIAAIIGACTSLRNRVTPFFSSSDDLNKAKRS
jgi:hypothetical protein